MCEGVPIVGGCIPVLEGVSQCGTVWTGLINIVTWYFLKTFCDMTTDLLCWGS